MLFGMSSPTNHLFGMLKVTWWAYLVCYESMEYIERVRATFGALIVVRGAVLFDCVGFRNIKVFWGVVVEVVKVLGFSGG